MLAKFVRKCLTRDKFLSIYCITSNNFENYNVVYFEANLSLKTLIVVVKVNKDVRNTKYLII